MRSLSFRISVLLASILGAASANADTYLTTNTGAATGDCSNTIDVTNLQTALKYCSDNNVTCEIPSGVTYCVTKPIFMWGNSSLISSGNGGIKINDVGNNAYIFNFGISAKYDGINHLESLFTGSIKGVNFSVVGGAGGRILYFWRTDGATISDNTFNVGTYPYSATSSGNNNNWVINGNPDTLPRKNIKIVNNVIVAASGPVGNEGIGLNSFDGATIEGNTVTGVGDDPVGIHFSQNVKILSNILRSIDGRIYLSSSQYVEIANNIHIRIPARTDNSFYQGNGLIYAGFESAGKDNLIYGTHDKANDYVDIHDNKLYYPLGSKDTEGAISLHGARHTTVTNNYLVSDAENTRNYAVYILPQQFQTFQPDANGKLIPAQGVATWQDPTGLDPDLYKGGTFNFARGHEITLNGNISDSSGSASPLSFVMLDNCDTWVGPVTLVNNVAPTFLNFFSIYRNQCPSGSQLILEDGTNSSNTPTGTLLDTDGDGYPNMFDNCPITSNANQADSNGNGIGDACEHGLKGSYYNSNNLSGIPIERIDSIINFNWGSGSPASQINQDNFSVRWTGKVMPPTTGTYKFCARTDDGVRLTVNGQALVDYWLDQSATERCGKITLTQGQAVSIQMDYYERGGDAVARLRWAYPTGNESRAVVPTTQLYAQ